MIDFSGVRAGTQPLAELAAGVSKDDLYRLNDELVDAALALLRKAEDKDATFVAKDASAEGETGWSVAHVVAHATASSEEGAAHAAQLARGIPVEGRSRFETPSESLTTVEAVRARLEDSRRIRRGYLDAWPSQPNLDVTWAAIARFGPLNAVARFLLGAMHEDGHVQQMGEVLRQASAART
jgi:hypothetical protein